VISSSHFMFAVLVRLLGGLGPSRGTWSGPICDPSHDALAGGWAIDLFPAALSFSILSLHLQLPSNAVILAIEYAHITFQV
jgi:hypothetical protein